MSIQLKILKRLITDQAALTSHHASKATSLLPLLAIFAKPHFKSPNFCTETAIPSATPAERGVVSEFLLSKCSLTEEDITQTFKSCNHLLRAKSVQTCEEVLELLNGCGLTDPTQIRKVTLRYPVIFFYRNIKSKLSFLRTFMKDEDIAKLILRNARFISLSEDRLKSAVSLLRKLGLYGKALSELLSREPHFLMATEKDVRESFKNAEDLGITKGSKAFSYALQATLGVGKEKLDRRRMCFSSLGFREEQLSDFLRRQPLLLALSEGKVKRNGNFLVNFVGCPLDDLVKCPYMFQFSLEKRIIPRYRVMEALKSMQVPKTRMSFPCIVRLTEKRFFEKIVNSNPRCSSVLLDIYRGGKADKEMCSKYVQ